MRAINTINSLLESVEKLDDGKLREEMRGKVVAVRDDLVATYEQLRTKQEEFEGLKTQSRHEAAQPQDRNTSVYDPPV